MAVQEDVDIFVLASINPAQNRKSKQIAFLFCCKTTYQNNRRHSIPAIGSG